MKTLFQILPTTGGSIGRMNGGTLRLAGLLAVLTFFLSGCYYTLGAARYIERTAGDVPWWCQGTPDLTPAECQLFSAYLDHATRFAFDRWTYADGTAAGGSAWAGDARVQVFGTPTSFDPMAPNLIEYDSTAAGARAIGVGWRIQSVAEPAGFAGSRDTWVADTTTADTWILRTWSLRGYENHPDVFAATHPCQASLPLASTGDACYIASHTVPLDVMITNDDGYDAAGIDALVEAVRVLPGVNVTVVAPLTPQSGQGSNTTPGGAPAADTDKFTLSGYPVLAAVHGTPADTSIWALQTLFLSPDVVLSGINAGQNLANVGHLASGTVGAARAATRRFANAIATSQEGAPIPDFPAGAAATLDLLEQWRIGAAGVPHMVLPNINIPTCSIGSIRGTVETIVGLSITGRGYGPSDCQSTVNPPFLDDLDAFLNGYTSIADMGDTQPPNYP